jgi:hypothetical protein
VAGGSRLAPPLPTSRARSEEERPWLVAGGSSRLAPPLPTSREGSEEEGRGWWLAARGLRLHSQLLERRTAVAGGWRLAAPLPTSRERSEEEGHGWWLVAHGSTPNFS